MAGAGWSTADALRVALLRRGWEFEFSQAVTLLERFYAPATGVGGSGPFADELIRFRPSPSLTPSSKQIREILEEDGGFTIITGFYGLYGMSAPGPPYIFEAAANRPLVTDDETDAGDRSQALRSFLDIFNNRLLGLFHKAGVRYRWTQSFRASGTDAISRRAFALGGLEATETSGVIEPRARLLRYLGLFSSRTRTAAGLRSLLWDYYSGPDAKHHEYIDIEEFVGRWVRLDGSSRTRLGVANSHLNTRGGACVVLGGRVQDRLGTFRVVLGPLDMPSFRRFLPDGADFAELVALIDLYRPDQLDFQVRLRLRRRDVPPLRLSSNTWQRLGWSSWLHSPSKVRAREGVVDLRRSGRPIAENPS